MEKARKMLWYLILWLVTASLCSDTDSDTDSDSDEDDENAKVNLHFSVSEEGSTGVEEIDSLPQLAEVDDAQHRGWKWYDDTSKGSEDGQSSAFKSEASSSLSSISSVESKSSSASSQESSARKSRKRVYRTCTPCPQDMLRSFRNKGIKWICAGYQRARRTFKSTCMMRYRNCEDGTMFVKLYDRRCKNDSYHGKHFFYTYRT